MCSPRGTSSTPSGSEGANPAMAAFGAGNPALGKSQAQQQAVVKAAGTSMLSAPAAAPDGRNKYKQSLTPTGGVARGSLPLGGQPTLLGS